MSAEGRSRAYAGGRSVPVSLLTYLADDLVAVHGQADQQQLLQPARQREALDRYAGPGWPPLLADYQRAYQRHREVRAELDELTTRARERAPEAEDLRRGLAEIERPSRRRRGRRAAGRGGAARRTPTRCTPRPRPRTRRCSATRPAGTYEAADAVTLLARPGRRWRRCASTTPRWPALADRLYEAAYLVSDVAGELASYAQSVDADPARLAAVQERRAELGPRPAPTVRRGAAAVPQPPGQRTLRPVPAPRCWPGATAAQPGSPSWRATTTGSPAWPSRRPSWPAASPSWPAS